MSIQLSRVTASWFHFRLHCTVIFLYLSWTGMMLACTHNSWCIYFQSTNHRVSETAPRFWDPAVCKVWWKTSHRSSIIPNGFWHFSTILAPYETRMHQTKHQTRSRLPWTCSGPTSNPQPGGGTQRWTRKPRGDAMAQQDQFPCCLKFCFEKPLALHF